MDITVKEIQEWLIKFTKEINENKSYLSDLDTPIGDGDHGNNMGRGVSAFEDAFKKEEPTTISDTFKVLSMAMISKVGGASGPLYGSAFMNMMKATKDVDVINSQEQLGKIIEEGTNGIQARGKAEAEDKTMLDVWLPVTEALKNNQLTADVIENAKEHTKNLVAKKGRASYLGERAIGHIDPGAASSAILFQTLLDVIHG
ncbi:dihydroxyacetone kinase subunit L [Enterococcus durans]|uniref:phosphoenolpyruvate--glycerone phosphotransferase n=1 Tax=Enterococcus durans TaxID=53345 RepID=A0A5N0YW07_9ENTE|nr:MULTISPECIES: dihydroxyacetone kinase subunit DhaL [Enterococcus]KAA9179645.1 dihydroxyacetone kinase subunit L [Enterococcus durans]KAA9184962.1 dihydroxyacetone kinase subunit L [Enterococcus durans]KAA9185965.1 dihydroxyacetone kinase subunit L [Enterococcus durans]KAA9190385.1 dihydroxyacetone kinase subunit L [Enterococcus durans]KAA9194526.1 dihydroxyacetone kinase subunit L [Enterococcus durans]